MKLDSELRIFARLPLDRHAIVEIARLPHGGSYEMVSDTLRSLPEHSDVWMMDRAVDADRIVARRGQRRLRCDEGRVRKDFASSQAAAAADPGVMFV